MNEKKIKQNVDCDYEPYTSIHSFNAIRYAANFSASYSVLKFINIVVGDLGAAWKFGSFKAT